jgi:hypothetical protein
MRQPIVTHLEAAPSQLISIIFGVFDGLVIIIKTYVQNCIKIGREIFAQPENRIFSQESEVVLDTNL